MIVGSAVIERVEPVESAAVPALPAAAGAAMYRWHLAGVERLATPRKPDGHPQPVWFRPF